MENKKRLIDANALELEPDFRNVMNGVRFGGRGGGRTAAMVQVALKHMIDNAHTVDAVPVVHGRWGEHLSFTAFGEYNGSLYECSNCHSGSYDDAFEHFHYCPNCGAKMDGGAEG